MKVIISEKKIQGLALFHIFLKLIKTVNQSENPTLPNCQPT